MLYRIEGSGVRLVGTAPAFPADKAQIPPWLRRVFDQSDEWVFETDLAQLDPAALLLPAHQSLTVLAFFDQVSALWKRLEIEGRPARFKAWAAAERLSAHLAGLAAPGVEELMLPEAGRQSAAPRFLELPAERVAAFDAAPLEEQLTRLEAVAAQPEAVAAWEAALHEAWVAHNLGALTQLLDAQRKNYPESLACRLDRRNWKWLPELTRIIQQNGASQRPLKTLVAVGAAHLGGEQGIIALLSKEGFGVTRLL